MSFDVAIHLQSALFVKKQGFEYGSDKQRALLIARGLTSLEC